MDRRTEFSLLDHICIPLNFIMDNNIALVHTHRAIENTIQIWCDFCCQPFYYGTWS